MPRFIDSANPGYVKARNELLTQKGFDPSKYDIDFDSGRIVERDQFSALGAAGTAAAYNAPEAMVGSGAAALASLLPAPPIIKIPAMIGSALLAPMLASPATSALKEAVVPGAGAAFTQARREHPWASAIGGQAAALAGGMRLSISTPVEAARGLRSLIAGVPVARLSAQQGGALLNTGVGVGLGAGIPLARGEPLSEVAAGAAGGLAFTEPSWLGRKVFGFSPTPAASAGYAPPSKPVAPAAQKPVQDYSAFDTGEYQHSESDFIGYEPDERSYWEYSGGDYEQPFIDAEAKRRKDDFFLARAEQRRQIDAELATPKNVASSQKYASQVAAQQKAAADKAKADAEAESRSVVSNPYLSSTLLNQLQANQILGSAEKPRPKVTKYTRQDSYGPDRTLPVEDVPKTEYDILQDKLEGTRERYQQEGDQINFEGLSPEAQKNYNNFLQQFAAKKGVTLQTEYYPLSESGQPVAGKLLSKKDPLADAVAVISKNAGIDTVPHELLHNLVIELSNGTPGERRFISRALNTVGMNEEQLVQASGQEFVERFFSGKSPSVIRDLASLIRDRFLLRGTQGDYKRILTNILAREGDKGNRVVNYTPNLPQQSQKNEPVERTQLSQNQGLPYRQLGPQNTDIPVRRGLFASETDKLRQAGPVHGELADAFERLYANRRAMQGRYANPMIHAASKLNPAQRKQLYDTLLTENQTGREQLLNITDPEVRQAYGVYRDVLELMSRDRIKAGQPVMLSDGTVREHRSNPYYMFNTVSSDVRRILNEGQGTPAFEALKNDFIQHQIQSGDGRITEDEAVRRFNSLLGSFHESPASNPASFKGVRLPEGYGLPDSWIEKDLVKATRQYVNMYTRDRAFWDTIETNPRLMKMLGSASYRGTEQIPPEVQAELANYNLAHDKQVQNIKAHYLGSSITGQEPIISSLGRLVNSAILGGPVTKLTDMFTVPVKALAYTPVGNIGAIVKGIAEWRKGIDDSFATGFNRRGGLIVAQDILGIGEYTASMLDKVAEGITKWTASEALELASRGLSQSIGTFIGDSQRALARAGNREAVEFLTKLGSDWDSLSREELGTRIGQLFQGRYDITNLPRWALDSPVAPFVGMMKWSIEQANNFRKFVVAPALRGNLAPAAMTLIGGLGGGLVLNELRQMIGGSPSQVPTWKEIEQADDKTEAVAYKLISAAQVTGTAGIFSEMLKQVYESMSGRLPQGFRYPLFSVAGDITQRFTSAAKAVADGEDIGLVTAALMRDIMKTHVQILRTLHNQLGQLGVGEIAPGVDPAKAVTQQRQRRDLRMFERLRGYQQGSVVRTAPDYSKLSEQRFDEADPSEAAAMLPSLLSRYAKQSRTPGQMAGRLRQLGAGDTSSIVPSPNTDPQRFGEYLQFIERTQGPDAVRRLMAEYHRRQAESSIKKSMIPKL